MNPTKDILELLLATVDYERQKKRLASNNGNQSEQVTPTGFEPAFLFPGSMAVNTLP